MNSPITAPKAQDVAGNAAGAPWRRTVNGHYVWLVRPDLTQEDMARLFEGMSRPVDFIKRPDDRSSSAVLKISTFAAKRYRGRTFRDRIKAIVRGSRAQQALCWAARLTDLGVPTIRPAAVAYAKGRPWESCLVSDHIALRCTIHQGVQGLPLSLQRRWVINALADTMSQLHNADISHGDAHLANFIVERADPPRVVLVDLDALRGRKMSTSVAANDLKRLLDYAPGSQLEHLRFLVAYARARRPRIGARDLLPHLQAQRRGPCPLRDASCPDCS